MHIYHPLSTLRTLMFSPLKVRGLNIRMLKIRRLNIRALGVHKGPGEGLCVVYLYMYPPRFAKGTLRKPLRNP